VPPGDCTAFPLPSTDKHLPSLLLPAQVLLALVRAMQSLDLVVSILNIVEGKCDASRWC